MILAGDIGGTNARLASFEVVHGRVKPLVEETFPSHAYASLDDIVHTFVSAHDLRVAQACCGVEPAWLTEELHQGDRSAVISRVALAGTCDLCVQALDLFVALYGAEAGNLALKVLATGGVFVGGGIAPKIVDKLQDTTFIQTFAPKAGCNQSWKQFLSA